MYNRVYEAKTILKCVIKCGPVRIGFFRSFQYIRLGKWHNWFCTRHVTYSWCHGSGFEREHVANGAGDFEGYNKIYLCVVVYYQFFQLKGKNLNLSFNANCKYDERVCALTFGLCRRMSFSLTTFRPGHLVLGRFSRYAIQMSKQLIRPILYFLTNRLFQFK